MPIIIAFLILAQDAGPLVEQLSSESPTEREQAFAKLKELGAKALDALDVAAKSNDPEVAVRARQLAAVIRLLPKLGPRLVKELPGVEDRLSLGEPKAWSEALLEAVGTNTQGRPLHPTLLHEDLEALAPLALKNAPTHMKNSVLTIVQNQNLRSAIPSVVELLASPNPSTRQEVANCLQAIGAGEAIPSLIEMLSSKNHNTATSAATIVGDLRAPEAIQCALPLLEHESPWVRERAMDIITTNYGWREHRDKISKLLSDPSDNVRARATDALAVSGQLDNRKKLYELLRDDGPATRSFAAYALAAIGDRAAIPPLIKMLDDSHSNVRAAAAYALGNLGAKEAVDRIVKLLVGGNSHEKAYAVYALRELALQETLDKVTPLLKDKDTTVQWEVIQSIGLAGETRLVSDILPILSLDETLDIGSHRDQVFIQWRGRHVVGLDAFLTHKEPEVRSTAARAIGLLGAKEFLKPLAAAAADADPKVRYAVAWALGQIPERENADTLSGMISDADISVRIQAAIALARLGQNDTIPSIVKILVEVSVDTMGVPELMELDREKLSNALDSYLNNANPQLVARAVMAIGFLRLKNLSTKLFDLLESPSEVQGVAFDALTAMDSWPDAQRLGKLLENKDEQARLYACKMLAQIGAKDAVPKILQEFKKSLGPSRAQIGVALAKLGVREIIPELCALVRGNDPAAKPDAIEGLATLKAREAAPLLIDQLCAGADVARAAAVALPGLCTPEEFPKLVQALKSTNLRVRNLAVSIFDNLAQKEMGAKIETLLDDEVSWIRELALNTLANMGCDASSERIILRLKDSSPLVREAAARALGKLGARTCANALEPLLEDPDAEVRRHVVLTLAEFKCAKALPQALALVETAAPDIAADALYAVAKLQGKECHDLLIRLLKHPSTRIVSSALSALTETQAPDAVQQIRPFLQHQEGELRIHAAEALCRLGSLEAVPFLLEMAETRRWYNFDPLCTLNLLRYPNAYRKLEACPQPRPLNWDKENCETLAHYAGLALELESSINFNVPYFTNAGWDMGSIQWPGHDDRWFDRVIAELRTCGFAVVLEQDRLRIVHRSKALTFWKAWLKNKR